MNVEPHQSGKNILMEEREIEMGTNDKKRMEWILKNLEDTRPSYEVAKDKIIKEIKDEMVSH